jgi:hypothetical protein
VWIISGASIYQPNPVMRDVEFARGWEQRYPALAGSGFRDVWDLSLKHNGGDPRFFVRYSSWTSGSILERLQPALDRLWSRQISVGELRTTVNDINGGVREELEKTLQQRTILPGFRRHLEQALKDLDEPSAH